MNAFSPFSAASAPPTEGEYYSNQPPPLGTGTRRVKRRNSAQANQQDVAEQLAVLASMDRNDLMAEWRKQFRSGPPDRIRRELLELGIAWKIQENAFGGLKKAITSGLRRLSDDLTQTGDIRRVDGPLLKPGTRLLREWGGVTHEVTVIDDGFLWRGKTWKSLSAIAEKISGAHWSGPRFFGLKKRLSSAVATDQAGNASTEEAFANA